MPSPLSLSAQFTDEVPRILDAYEMALREQGNPLAAGPVPRQECREHAEILLNTAAAALDGTGGSGTGSPEALAREGETRWACCRAPLTDLTAAMEALEHVALDTALRVAADVVPDERASFVARAGRAVHAIGYRHTTAAARLRDAELARRVERAATEARVQVARDIHDRLGSSLVLAQRHLEIYRGGLRRDSDARDEHLDCLQSSLREATTFARALMSGLRARAPRTGLVDALTTFGGALNGSGAEVSVSVEGDEGRLDDRDREELFLVIREFMRNSLTHGAPSIVAVEMRVGRTSVDVDAYDDGCGFTAGEQCGMRQGGGLSVMRERIERLGGQFLLHSGRGHGTRMRLCAPLRGEPTADRGLGLAWTDRSQWAATA